MKYSLRNEGFIVPSFSKECFFLEFEVSNCHAQRSINTCANISMCLKENTDVFSRAVALLAPVKY